MTETLRQTVVVVDDDPALRRLLQRQIERAGYPVAVYDHGRAALAALGKLTTAIVIADWSMPELDGLELCRSARELESLHVVQNVYFILLTAQDSKQKVIEGLDAGANDYLTKPYHEGELLARIQVGERVLRLQSELLQRNIEVQKVNTQMAVLAQRLEELARTDGLTGLFNRRYVFERFDTLWAQCDRQTWPLCCIMLDVDHFKSVNDTHGHAVGDEILKAIAQVIQGAAQHPGHCGRVGGEEFLVLCPGLVVAQAARLADAIRGRIEALTIETGAGRVGATVSCGVAERGPHTATPDQLMQRADALLYAAKQHGRNQTWICPADGNVCCFLPTAAACGVAGADDPSA